MSGSEAPFASVCKGWRRPEGRATEVKIYNSLTRSKVDFVPMDPMGRSVSMYVCGPTVYDASHLGHARTYIQFDVVRRILRDVAGFDVTYVMNVTDVDDKIIGRSLERGVSSVALAREWEQKFLEDMATLNVERPTVMPRVTEYVPEIVRFVEKIVSDGCAYESNGSVYFDTVAFEAKGFKYAKLMPEHVGSAALMAEGEGALSEATTTTKKDPKDFALWKKSKDREPSWESPWGLGRPGWHIECSAMMDATIGKGRAIDIHGGGTDLKFPHHDNELAQSEAFCNCGQTVNYFAHTGHLNIDGLKMSKSLKNFITIRQAIEGIVDGDDVKLQGTRPSTMRLMFLQCAYNKPADYSDNMLQNARNLEKKFKEFFLNVDAALRKLESDSNTEQRWSRKEELLEKERLATDQQVRLRLLDDFDTPGAMLLLQRLVDAVNVYLRKPKVVPLVVAAAAASIARTLKTLGLPEDSSLMDSLIYGKKKSSSSEIIKNDNSRQAILEPVLDALTKFRDDVRQAAKSGGDILSLCDDFRDVALPDLGVRLEDKNDGSIWKLEDPDLLKKERAIKLEEEADKKRTKDLADAKKAAKAKAQADAANLKPQDLFKDKTHLYSQFDSDGIPTHDAQGEPISKSQLKKLKKEWEKQSKLYNENNTQDAAA